MAKLVGFERPNGSSLKIFYFKNSSHQDENPSKGAIGKALAEFGSTFRNPAFLPYLVGVFFYRMAIMITLPTAFSSDWPKKANAPNERAVRMQSATKTAKNRRMLLGCS